MADPPLTPHFFKPLLPGFTDHIDIPVAFFSKHIKGSNNGNTARLKSDALDITWKVKMNGRRLCDGWEAFTVAHDLRVGDIVVFRHEEEMMFHVTAFGPSCCEIQYAPFCTNNNENNTFNVKTETFSSNKNSSETKSLSDHSRFVSHVTASNLSRDARGLPKSFTTPNGVSKNCQDVILINEEGKSWNLDLKYKKISGGFYMRRGWRSFCEANGKKAGGSFNFELVQNGKTGTPLVLQLCRLDSGNQDKLGRDSRKKEVEEEQNEEEAKAESFSTDNDSDDEGNMRNLPKNKKVKTETEDSSFVAFVTAANLSSDTLYLPISFTRSNGMNNRRSKEIVLKNENGESWTLILRHKSWSGCERLYMKRGWKSFCIANERKVGEFFTFILVKNGETPVLQLIHDMSNLGKFGDSRKFQRKKMVKMENQEVEEDKSSS